MNINDSFPSKYLKASDIPPRTRVTVIMDKVAMEDLGSDRKPVVYFVGKEKGLVLNKTNGLVIADLWGAETDAWHGKPIRLFADKVQFEGQLKPCIRVSTEPVDMPEMPPPTVHTDDSDIPF